MEDIKIDVTLRERVFQRMEKAAEMSGMSVQDFCEFAINCYSLEVLGSHHHHEDPHAMEMARKNKIDKLWLLFDMGTHGGSL